MKRNEYYEIAAIDFYMNGEITETKYISFMEGSGVDDRSSLEYLADTLSKIASVESNPDTFQLYGGGDLVQPLGPAMCNHIRKLNSEEASKLAKLISEQELKSRNLAKAVIEE